MEFSGHVLLFLFSAGVVWFFAGLLIESTDHLARHFHKNGFIVAFFVLGFITSISEISVAVNATIKGVPEISAGNLVGASFVILLFIIPFLAAIGNKIELRHTLSRQNLRLALVTILLPVLFVVDEDLTRIEGVLMLIIYIALLVAIRGQKETISNLKNIKEDLLPKGHPIVRDAAMVVLAGVFIFIAGHFFVEQSVYFASALGVPNSLIGLVLLSLGTNVPEITIAIRSIIKAHKDIAFGDYVGSAVTNTPIFALLPIVNGTFRVESSEFIATAWLMSLGLIAFYIFARSERSISRREGFLLLVFYALFLIVQVWNVFRFAAN
ncbi:MAG: hypothetical protein A2945_05340 [Candidatus Liptonbacteria bacterium RIFCSPLOWO2_01_FULL_52_25]|uniref:Sodium/calcium exchanger membrane region domain-containing protein n=1 Tax=Candidatus Liptonbacteria bacterium RIFCSPLOWO2_01_FULL_52_25 TaxID=1798650 RepID=A0A1G2CD53_9BACT|nr:MAG: hypothetical protein A2945_05340 [Candidatus Liptonbacteria bacterium RIFCSPLOWO2_01_FULL_52_25]